MSASLVNIFEDDVFLSQKHHETIENIWRCKRLANIKSAKKRILVNKKKYEKNKAIKSKVKTAVKKVDAAILAEDKAVALEALKAAVVEIDKATTKGIYHKNTSSRKVSRLTKAVNAMN
jgi:small subunit ribosomal protein S20